MNKRFERWLTCCVLMACILIPGLVGGCAVVPAPGESAVVSQYTEAAVMATASTQPSASLVAITADTDAVYAASTSNPLAMFAGEKLLVNAAYLTYMGAQTAYLDELSTRLLTSAQKADALAITAQYFENLGGAAAGVAVPYTYTPPATLARLKAARTAKAAKAIPIPPWFSGIWNKLTPAQQQQIMTAANATLDDLIAVGEADLTAAINAWLQGDPYAMTAAVSHGEDVPTILGNMAGNIQVQNAAGNTAAANVAELRNGLMGLFTAGISVVASLL